MITNRITQLFGKKKENILNVFFTAGFPNFEDTLFILKELEKAGVDMVELGVPYSDPLADGPTIQGSSLKALDNGMTIKKLLQQLQEVRKEVSLPILLMGYLNPVIQYGLEKFCDEVGALGIDGLILPDLPMYEYKHQYKEIFQRNNLSNIFLVTPQTSDERLQEIDEVSEGFIYALSSNSTTGNEAANKSLGEQYLTSLSQKELKNPVLVGFNIKDKASYEEACQYGQGAIIGSAFIKAINKEKLEAKDIQSFVASIR